MSNELLSRKKYITKFPWKVTPEKSHATGGYFEIIGADETFPYQKEPWNASIATVRNKENACLIAASPELYTALIQAYQRLSEIDSQEIEGVYISARLLSDCACAILKAEGR